LPALPAEGKEVMLNLITYFILFISLIAVVIITEAIFEWFDNE
jgi:hypothetical protein